MGWLALRTTTLMETACSDTPIAPASAPVVEAAKAPVVEAAQGWGTPRQWFQVGLGDVAVWVFGAALFSVLARRWFARWWGPFAVAASSASRWISLAAPMLLVVL